MSLACKPEDNAATRSLDDAVKEFFLTVNRQDGEGYISKSLHTLNYGIKQFIMKELGKDIIEEGNFPQSAEAFKVATHIAKRDKDLLIISQ